MKENIFLLRNLSLFDSFLGCRLEISIITMLWLLYWHFITHTKLESHTCNNMLDTCMYYQFLYMLSWPWNWQFTFQHNGYHLPMESFDYTFVWLLRLFLNSMYWWHSIVLISSALCIHRQHDVLGRFYVIYWSYVQFIHVLVSCKK